MKKALGILSVLVLITVMMISCNAEQKLDDTVGVSFNVSSSRDLNVENQPFESVSSENLTWYYHGVKMSDEQFITGQSGTGEKYWTRISTGKELSTTSKQFSQGQWSFEIKAMKGDTQMYYGKTNGNVLLTKENRTISISVSPFVSGVKGTLKIDSVYIDPKDAGSDNVAPNKLLVNGDEKLFTLDNGGKSISFTELVEPGTYTVEVKRFGEDEGIVLASASKTVVVYSGLTTTIKGSVEEDTTSGKFDPQLKGTETVTVPTAEDAEVKFVNVTPSMEANKSTTVTIPYAVVTSETRAVTLDIVVKDSESVADNSFDVTTGNGVAASISLTMKDGDTVKTNFGSNKVTVETYIDTGLSGVTVKYNGTDAAPSDITYDPVTGYLKFKTTHFSEFYVEAKKQAKIGNEEYLTLQKAFDAAEDGDTVILLVNVDPTQTLVVSKNITLDMNGKTISNTRDIWNDATGNWSLISVRGGNLTVIGNGSLNGKTNDCFAFDVMNGGNLVIENGTFVGNCHAVYVYEGSLLVNGGEYSVIQKYSASYPDEYVLNCYDSSYKNGTASIVVKGGKFHGFNPANCRAEGIGTSFIEDWYISRNIGSEAEAIYEVGPADGITISSNEALASALANTSDKKIIYLTEGNFTLPSGYCENKNVKMVGSGEETVLSILPTNALAYQNGATLVFENMTIKGQNGGDFGGLAHTNKVTYNNCKILGKITLYAGVEKFINCTFENKNDYAIWTWGGKEVTLTGCTFNSGGKAVNLYGGAGSSETPTTVLTVTNCVFNDDDTLVDAKKAAIEIGNDYGATYKLNVTNTTVNGFAINPEGISTGTTLWANKKSMDADHLFVTVNNKKVYGN